MKSEAERNVENITLGAMLILVGVHVVFRLGWFFPALAALILLGSAYYQGQRGWRVSPWTWIVGVAFAAWAALSLVGGVLGFLWSLWPLVLIGLGVLLLYNILSSRR